MSARELRRPSPCGKIAWRVRPAPPDANPQPHPRAFLPRFDRGLGAGPAEPDPAGPESEGRCAAIRGYEAMLILRPDLEEGQTEALVERFGQLIQAQGGTVDNVEGWGKRRLAYEVNGHREGVYVVLNFKGEPAVGNELDRVLKLSDEVLRHMIIREGE